jgi:hypothetical protein
MPGRSWLKVSMTMITRDDVNVTHNLSGPITVSAMVNGYRESTQYFFVDEDYAVADFLATYGEDA